MATSFFKSIFALWAQSLLYGIHAVVSLTATMWIIQAVLALVGMVIPLKSGGNSWISIGMLFLVGLPLFGFLFTSLYRSLPKLRVREDETRKTSHIFKTS